MKRTIKIELGALAEPLHNQLKPFLPLRSIRTDYVKDADSITRLQIQGLLTESEAHKARKRLLSVITKRIKLGRATPIMKKCDHENVQSGNYADEGFIVICQDCGEDLTPNALLDESKPKHENCDCMDCRAWTS